jgi:hypothetical protein
MYLSLGCIVSTMSEGLCGGRKSKSIRTLMLLSLM